MAIKATHIKSGFTGEIQDEMTDIAELDMFYFQSDWNPQGTVSGWFYSYDLEISGVNILQ